MTWATVVLTSARLEIFILTILSVTTDLDIFKLSDVETDNASVMRTAWEIMETRHPTAYVNDCATHVIDHLVKEMCDLQRMAPDLAQAIPFVKVVTTPQNIRECARGAGFR